MGKTLSAILLGGLVAGAFDFVAAMVLYHLTPLQVGQVVATGWLGAAARSGGLQASIIGALSHFGIAIGAAAVYVAATRRLPALKAQWILGGLVFGLCVYAVMNALVVPLSAAPPRTTPPHRLILEALAVHMALVGLPIAWFARKS